MRNRLWLALAPVLLATALGCAMPDNPRALSWLDQVRSGAALDPGAVVVEIALIERPAGEPYLNGELWACTDELIVDLERRGVLEENGLRVGQVVGTPPAGFLTLLLSKRSCANPHHLIVPAGKAVPADLGAVLPHCQFTFVDDAGQRELLLDRARFSFDVVPTLTADGRTRLLVTPRVEHGELQLPFQASLEEGSWVVRNGRASRSFSELAFEAVLAPGQYLVVGGRLDRPDRLGCRAFVQEDDAASVQRLLVLRTNRSLRGGDVAQLDDPADALPLALQAATPLAVRAGGN